MKSNARLLNLDQNIDLILLRMCGIEGFLKPFVMQTYIRNVQMNHFSFRNNYEHGQACLNSAQFYIWKLLIANIEDRR